jgi:hypothetical protein
MGPSSAGATGPMQFPPSRRENARVDGKATGSSTEWTPKTPYPLPPATSKAATLPLIGTRALYSYNHAY